MIFGLCYLVIYVISVFCLKKVISWLLAWLRTLKKAIFTNSLRIFGVKVGFCNIIIMIPLRRVLRL